MAHKINHLAIVVPKLDESLTFWRDALGLELVATEENPDENVNIGFVALGDMRIELLEPTNADSGIGKYLEKKGPGMHHVCIQVEDIEASMQRLRDHQIQLINETPKVREGENIRYCFIHPKSTNGVLVELYEVPNEA
jgi:methylmalonyl-CoA/ethylmalonyl-CoA epimerase